MDKGNPLTVEEAAEILKISKYTLYELIKRGEIPSHRIGRQIRIEYDAIMNFLGIEKVPLPSKEEQPAQPLSDKKFIRFAGSHDLAVELLFEFWEFSNHQVSIVHSFNGSMEGLMQLFRGQADIVGVHLWDDKTGEYNTPFLHYVLPGESVKILNLAQRIQGWIVPKGNPYQLHTWEDITKKGLRFANRQKGSGTRLRVDSYLRKANILPESIKGYQTEETTHSGVAHRIANGEADAGIGIQAAAQKLGLDFIPLFKERYDLVCLEDMGNTHEWGVLAEILNSAAFHNSIDNQAGYDSSLTGKEISFGSAV